MQCRLGNIPRKLLIGLAFALSLATGASAGAQTTIKIGWPTADSKDDPYAIMAHAFAKDLEALAPGKYKVQFYPSHQLGTEAQMLQGLRLGTIDMTVSTATAVGNIVPSFHLMDLPFLFSGSKQAHTVLDGKAGKIMFEQLAKKGIIGLGFAEAGFRNVINNVHPIYMPKDLAGVKLRVQPSHIFLDSFAALGANPVPMPWNNVFTAVQQGTIDGLEIPLAVIYANKYPEITKYLSLTRHTYNADALLVSGGTWKKIGPEQQKIFRQAADKAIKEQRATVAALNVDILKKIKSSTGMKVNDIKDLSAFRKLVKPIYKEYRDKIGPDVLDAALAVTGG